MELAKLTRKVSRLLLILGLVFAVGVAGYMLLGGLGTGQAWSFLDALYMTVITLATVGYGETHPLGPAGRIFTVFLIIGGMTVVSYGVITITTLIAEGELQRLLRRGRMDKDISKLKDHYIVCGAGELGRHILKELQDTRQPFVLIDKNAETVKKLYSGEILFIQGDASEDAILQQAGIEKAFGIFCALPEDKDNLFVVLTASELNKHVRIISKRIEDESEQKFFRAGADKTISTNKIGGLRMTSEMLRPTTATFLDFMLRDKKNIRFEDVEVGSEGLAGKTLAETCLHDKTGAMVVAIRSKDGEIVYNPKGNTRIDSGSILVALGGVEQIEALRALSKK